MTSATTTPWPSAEKKAAANLPAGVRKVRPAIVHGSGAKARATDVATMTPTSRPAEYFATKASPSVRADSHQTPTRSSWRCRHQSPAAARKKNVMQASEVTRAPCARKSGEKTKNPRERKAPGRPNNVRDQQK